MNKIFIVIMLIVVFLAGTAVGAMLSEQQIWNDVWDSSASTLRITGV